MRTSLSAMIVLATLAAAGCSSSNSSGAASGQGATARSAQPAPAGTAARTGATTAAQPVAKSKDVSILKLDTTEVPAEVRAIEKLVDTRSALLADEVRIEVSKNYEWDVSLSGDGVTPQRPNNGGTYAEAIGNPRAYFRNLDIRARDKITIWRSGLGVVPFIKIYARGAVSYIDTDEGTGKPRVKRANACSINNARIAFDDQLIGVPGDN